MSTVVCRAIASMRSLTFMYPRRPPSTRVGGYGNSTPPHTDNIVMARKGPRAAGVLQGNGRIAGNAYGTVVRPLPRRPSTFSPVHHTVRSVARAQLWNRPTDTSAQSLRAPIRVGVVTGVLNGIPSCPSSLRPQHHKVP